MCNDKKDNMKSKNEHMEIIERKGQICLKYTYKIQKKEVIKKNKGKTLNKYYQAFMPSELVDYFKLKDLFFYEKEGKVYIINTEPPVEFKKIKLQKNNMFSIPRMFFNPAEFDFIHLIVDFSKVDYFKNGLGCLQVELS